MSNRCFLKSELIRIVISRWLFSKKNFNFCFFPFHLYKKKESNQSLLITSVIEFLLYGISSKTIFFNQKFFVVLTFNFTLFFKLNKELLSFATFYYSFGQLVG